MSRSHILPIEIFTGAQSYEGIGAAEHTEDANLIIVLKLKTRHHYACSENFLRQMYIGGIEPTRLLLQAAQTYKHCPKALTLRHRAMSTALAQPTPDQCID